MGKFELYVVFLVMVLSKNGSASKSSLVWCVKVDFALAGSIDTINITETQKSCHITCKDSGWCKSSNYEMASGQCELITASHYNDSRSLVPRKGWVYSYTKREVPTGAHTGCFHNTKQAAVGYPILKTPEKCPQSDFTQCQELCQSRNMQLCSLAQLKAAYDAGYRDDHWSFFDTPLRDVRVTTCGERYYQIPDECYFKVNGDPDKSLIPNTPRPYARSNVFCCLCSN